MGDTKIPYVHKVWNFYTGCTPVSPGCANCYARRFARRLAGRCGYPADDPFRVTFHPDKLDLPHRWRKPCRIFVNSMSDLFHPEIPFDVVARAFEIMHAARHHVYLVLTKRPQRMLEFVLWQQERTGDQDWPARNPYIWLGVTVEDRPRWDERVPVLKQIPAAIRVVSYEPALGFLGHIDLTGIGWFICGGETGPRARPMHPACANSTLRQCQAVGVPYYFKQWGEWISEADYLSLNGNWAWLYERDQYVFEDGVVVFRVGRKTAGRLLNRRTWDEIPEVRA